MADPKSGAGGWRIALAIVGATLGLLVFGPGGCDQSQCSCPANLGEAVIHLRCLPVERPVVKTTGPCSVCPVVLANGSIPEGAHCAVANNSQDITLTSNGAGTCHVELIFGSGATSSVDVDFMSQWMACGSDPHGCGQAFLAATSTVSVPDPMCDGGLDAEPSE